MAEEATLAVGRGSARLAIVDDHYLVRAGLRDMLAYEAGITVVGEAEDGLEAVEKCRELRPDLVLMDVRMPRMDGLAATREIKAEMPETGVLILTMHENPDYLLEALKAGAAGYVLKDAPHDELVSAIRRVLDGGSPLDPELAARLLKRLALDPVEAPSHRPTPSTEFPGEPLTEREREVLGLVAQGKTNREIAQSLVLSPLTVKVHVQHIIRKLEVSDRTQAAVLAIKLNLLS